MNQSAILMGLAIVVFLVTLISVVLFVVRRARKQQKTMGGEKVGLFKLMKGKHESRTYKGVPYQYDYHPGSKNNPSNLRITIQAASVGEFTLTKESRFDRFFKRLGVCVEIDTHDREFDDRFFITTNTVGFTRRFFTHRPNRSAAQRIFDCGFNHIVHDGQFMTAMIRPIGNGYVPGEDKIEETVAALITLTEKIPEPGHFPENDGEPPVNWKMKRFAAFAIPILLGVVGIIGVAIGFTAYEPFDGGSIFLNSLMVSIPMLCLFLWFVLRLISGRSSSHRELMMIAGISIGTFILAGFGLEVFLNGALDNHEASAYSATVTRTYYKKEKSGYKYFAKVESWREGRETETIKLTKSQYNRIKPHQTQLHVHTKPGKFGFPWLEHFHIYEPQSTE